MKKFISYNDSELVYLGMWQENGNGEIVCRGSISVCKFSFSGEEVFVDGYCEGDCEFFLDGKIFVPDFKDGYTVKTSGGEHTLYIKAFNRAKFLLKGFYIEENEKIFKAEEKPYILFIGDSITQCYIGYPETVNQITGYDYASVAVGGMSLVDGWGWYTKPEWMEKRTGMETRFFILEFPNEQGQTPYNFTFCKQPDYIVCFLGTNDYLGENEFYKEGHIDIFVEHYIKFIDRVKEKFPDSETIILQSLSYGKYRSPAISKAFEGMQKNHEKMHLLNSFEWNIDFSSDGTHPSALGYCQMGEKVAEYSKTI